MTRRSVLLVLSLLLPVVAHAQRVDRVALARSYARDVLALSIDGARPEEISTTLAEVRRWHEPEGRFYYFGSSAQAGTLDGPDGTRVTLVWLSQPRDSGTQGAVVVFDRAGHIVAGWELFSPD